MLEKVVLELGWEPAAEEIEELREGLALYQVKLESDMREKGEQGEGVVYITDRPDAVREKMGDEACILLFLTEENRKLEWGNIPYAVESLEGLDGDFLGKVYQRHRGEPWVILERKGWWSGKWKKGIWRLYTGFMTRGMRRISWMGFLRIGMRKGLISRTI